jgi:hypothetical protein
MDIPKNIVNRFGNADASGDGLTFQAGVITGTVNINRESREIQFHSSPPFVSLIACFKL